MQPQPNADNGDPDDPGGLPALAALSLIVGMASGLIGAVFRLCLLHGDSLRNALIAWAHHWHFAGLLVVVAACAATAGIAAWLVRQIAPHASGSGIPQVEAVLNLEIPQAPYVLIPVKFIGGLLAIGGGLALGREGPSVQMGASVAQFIGEVFRRKLPDCLVLLAAGAGAGLATAFNAPIAGAVFVLEELVRRFDTRTTIATFGASAGAIAVVRVLIGDEPDFQVGDLEYPALGMSPAHLVLGIVAGFLGVAYNRLILGLLAVADGLKRVPPAARAALTGAAVGLLAWSMPSLVGGGDPLTQRTLAGGYTTGIMVLVFLVRFGLGPVSYGAGTPGGLFAPLLVVGAQCGWLFGALGGELFPGLADHTTSLGIVGMAAFFTAVVRAPVTGIVLVIEMTGSFTLLLPLLSACFTAMLVPSMLGAPPIYDSLRERTLRIQAGIKPRLHSRAAAPATESSAGDAPVR